MFQKYNQIDVLAVNVTCIANKPKCTETWSILIGDWRVVNNQKVLTLQENILPIPYQFWYEWVAPISWISLYIITSLYLSFTSIRLVSKINYQNFLDKGHYNSRKHISLTLLKIPVPSEIRARQRMVSASIPLTIVGTNLRLVWVTNYSGAPSNGAPAGKQKYVLCRNVAAKLGACLIWIWLYLLL